jgi:hypothetical protein
LAIYCYPYTKQATPVKPFGRVVISGKVALLIRVLGGVKVIPPSKEFAYFILLPSTHTSHNLPL